MSKSRKVAIVSVIASICMAGMFSGPAFARGAATHRAASPVKFATVSPVRLALPSTPVRGGGHAPGIGHHAPGVGHHARGVGHHPAGSSAANHSMARYIALYKTQYKNARKQAKHDNENSNFQADTNTINQGCKGWTACLAKYALDLSGDIGTTVTPHTLATDPKYSSLYKLLIAAYTLRERGITLPTIQ